MIQAFEKQRERTEKGKALRQALPAAAALMDEVRALWGAEWADAALREGLRLQREHARLQAERGQAAADAWLGLQHPKAPTLALHEAGHMIGCMPGRRAAVNPPLTTANPRRPRP